MKAFPILSLLAFILFSGCSKGPDSLIVFETGNPPPLVEVSDSLIQLGVFALIDASISSMKIQQGSYVKFADQKGNLASYSEGSYDYRKLSNSFYKRSENHKPLPEKYMLYIWEQMKAKEHPEEVKVKPTVLRFNPLADRGQEAYISPGPLAIESGEKVFFSWHPFDKKTEEYILAIKAMEGDWHKVIQTSDTVYTLPGGSLSGDAFYQYRVIGGGTEQTFFYTIASGDQ